MNEWQIAVAIANFVALIVGFAIIIRKDNRNDNLSKYFGTPRLAACTLLQLGCKCPLIVYSEYLTCAECPYEEDGLCGYRIVEWLQEEADDTENA